jgi:hypothetical protein
MYVSSVTCVVGFTIHTVWSGDLWRRWWLVFLEETLHLVDKALLTFEVGVQVGS